MEKRRVINFRCPPELWREFKKISEIQYETASHEIVVAMREYVNKRRYTITNSELKLLKKKIS